MSISEKDQHPSGATAQDHLVEAFCLQAQDALRQAPDRRSAEILAEDICDRFSRECASAMVVHATRSALRRWIADHWSQEP